MLVHPADRGIHAHHPVQLTGGIGVDLQRRQSPVLRVVQAEPVMPLRRRLPRPELLGQIPLHPCDSATGCPRAPAGDTGTAAGAPLFGLGSNGTGPWPFCPASPLIDDRALQGPRHANQAIGVAYRPGTEPLRFPTREHDMADKSPRHSMSKKSGKSIKEKRTERKAKADATAQMERLTRDKKH